jgi:hypothetical protein
VPADEFTFQRCGTPSSAITGESFLATQHAGKRSLRLPGSGLPAGAFVESFVI